MWLQLLRHYLHKLDMHHDRRLAVPTRPGAAGRVAYVIQ